MKGASLVRVMLILAVVAVDVVAGNTGVRAAKPPCVTTSGASTTTVFDDVAQGDTEAVANAVALGMMTGCGASYFCPADMVTREDLAVALVRGMDASSFQPAQVPFGNETRTRHPRAFRTVAS